MTQDQIEISILRQYVEQHKNAELRTPGSKCSRELDMREVLADITGESGRELEYNAQFWLDRLAPRTRDAQGPLHLCSDCTLNEREHRWHARAYQYAGSGSAPAWDRLRELQAKLHSSTHRGPGPWTRIGRWLLTTTGKIVIGVIIVVIGAWAVYKWGPPGRGGPGQKADSQPPSPARMAEQMLPAERAFLLQALPGTRGLPACRQGHP